MNWIDTIHVGDCRATMREMIAAGVRVNCIVTSPPYWGLRDYGVAGQFGLERTWLRHVARMRYVFRLARALLADDGVAWVNYGDSYSSGGRGGNPSEATSGLEGGQASQRASMVKRRASRPRDIAPKNLVGMPWRIAFALQGDGWYLRSDIIWHKPNPMPESCTDRPTKSHEHIFLMSREPTYFYDSSAAREAVNGNAHARRSTKTPDGWDTGKGGHGSIHREGREKGTVKRDTTGYSKQNDSYAGVQTGDLVETRNLRDVWTMPSEAFRASHFATFPRELVRRCILAGSRPGDIVFDPFMGSGTVAEVALDLGRRYVGCELNPEYAAMFASHRSSQQGFAL